MSATDIASAEARISYWTNKFYEIESKRKLKGKLKKQEWWEREYYQSPYLTFASDRYIESRFIDHFHNNVRITSQGEIAPRIDFADDSGLIGPIFSHLLLEIRMRGGLPDDVVCSANKELDKYFENGVPIGVRLFKEFPETLANVIVKFGKRQHLEPMIRKGEMRLTPASYYKRGSLVKAMRDLETERWFHDPRYDCILQGKNTFPLNGRDVDIEDGFLKFVISCPDYLLWSACEDIDRRLPTDFDGADSALIIRDIQEFSSRISRQLKKVLAGTINWSENVKYYDPCSFVDMKKRPETIKHFSFLYQREWRFCAFSPEGVIGDEPFPISIGSLSDIADLVTL